MQLLKLGRFAVQQGKGFFGGDILDTGLEIVAQYADQNEGPDENRMDDGPDNNAADRRGDDGQRGRVVQPGRDGGVVAVSGFSDLLEEVFKDNGELEAMA